MLYCCLAKYQDIPKVDEGELPFDSEKNDVHVAFKRFRRIAESKEHSNESV